MGMGAGKKLGRALTGKVKMSNTKQLFTQKLNVRPSVQNHSLTRDPGQV